MPSSTLLERVESVLAVTAEPTDGGVNLVGDFGDVRIHPYFDALAHAGVPIARLQWSGGMPIPIEDVEPFAFATTLVCVDGDQLVDYIGEVGLDSLKGRRTIVLWEWPHKSPPMRAAAEISMVNEVWVPSTFSAQAFADVSPRPVIRLPPRVVASTNLTRSDARMPDGFIFAAIARLGRDRPGDAAIANPLAAISAFRAAFRPGSGPKLQVVLQGKRTRATTEACLSAAAGRRDISILATDDALVAEATSVNADCMISLHRASAFGIDLARALASGHPVVATAYGGPMDYLIPDGAELVPYTLTRSEVDLHPFAPGTTWAEPDQDAAVQHLRAVYSDYERALHRAQCGRNAVARLCSPKLADTAILRQLGIPLNAVTARRSTSTSRR
jgi:glycosyltransferase involved in cell wall biosynthesis